MYTWTWATIALCCCCCCCIALCGGVGGLYGYQKNRKRNNKAWGGSGYEAQYGQEMGGGYNAYQNPQSYSMVQPTTGGYYPGSNVGYGPSYY